MVPKRPEDHLKVALQEQFNMPHSLITRSGSVAIILAMQAAGVSLGSQVIIPASCCPIVMYALQMAGYQTVLADVNLNTLNSDLSHIEAVINENTAAILAVHAYGRVCDIENIVRFSKLRGIIVIEDACLAYGGQVNERPIASFADISVISFGYDKPIAHGVGGAILFKDDIQAQNASIILEKNTFFQFPNHARDFKGIANEVKSLAAGTKQRIENVLEIDNLVSNPLFKKLSMPYNINYWRYPLLIEPTLRAKFIEFAKARNQVFTCHYQSLGALLTNSQVPNADHIGKSIINVFVKPQISKQEINIMAKIINEFNDDT